MGFVSANQVTIGHAAASREDALHYLSEQSVELGFADDASAVEAAFIARENEAETGLVAGFAVPHAKSDAIHTPGVVVLKLAEPVEWPSFDGVPVDVALALYVPAGEAGTTHLRPRRSNSCRPSRTYWYAGAARHASCRHRCPFAPAFSP